MFCFCGGFLYKSNKSHYIKLFIFRYVSLITGNFKIAFDNTGAVSSTYSLERPRTTDLFPRKSKGGQHCHYVSYQQGTLGDWKNNGLGHQSGRKGSAQCF